MKFNVRDRLVLLSVIPRQGDLTTLRIVRELEKSLSFSEKEHKVLKFNRDKEGNVFWENEQDKPKDIPIGPVAFKLICDRFRELNEQKKLSLEFLDVYEQFMSDASPQDSDK